MFDMTFLPIGLPFPPSDMQSAVRMSGALRDRYGGFVCE